MTANLLMLNSSKTELLLLNSKHNLLKYVTLNLAATTHSAHNFSFIFDEDFTFSDQISSLSKSCYYHAVNFTASAVTLIPK